MKINDKIIVYIAYATRKYKINEDNYGKFIDLIVSQIFMTDHKSVILSIIVYSLLQFYMCKITLI